MPALDFMPQWAPNVELGVYHANCMLPPLELRRDVITPKRCTIRKIGKQEYHPGQYISLYTGRRTKQVRLLGLVLCLGVTPIIIGEDYIKLGPQYLDADRVFQLAKVDTGGQYGPDEFRAFFRKLHGFPFAGQLISW